ncbi:hypothetical protein EYF80_041707 [Liparis tanakae]|uniref:Uncharacterized protein n=1 Tax=Liparis tanakae TaxID=230148 RepID=A0A4Z2G661_9TELE|nr:hypothetical protein EYF80_041707 [Liparis tanakae]
MCPFQRCSAHQCVRAPPSERRMTSASHAITHERAGRTLAGLQGENSRPFSTGVGLSTSTSSCRDRGILFPQHQGSHSGDRDNMMVSGSSSQLQPAPPHVRLKARGPSPPPFHISGFD